jgi:hypothetical protein
MRTVSTKLDKKDHERLLEICNDEGKSVAEELREMRCAVFNWSCSSENRECKRELHQNI